MSRSRLVGTLPDGRPVHAHVLRAEGLRLEVLDLGATVHSLRLTDGPEDVEVVLGYADLADHVAVPPDFHGAVVGRWANRIAFSRFTIDDATYELDANEGTTCLHGGPDGYHRRTWSVVEAGEDHLVLELVSPDGDAGFPGRLVARATYRVAPGEVSIELTATTDAPTVVSLTNHSYFDLGGKGSILDHRLTVDGGRWLPDRRHLDPDGGRGGRRDPVRPALAHAAARRHRLAPPAGRGGRRSRPRLPPRRLRAAPGRPPRGPVLGSVARRAHRPALAAGLHGQRPRRLASRARRRPDGAARRRRPRDPAPAGRPEPARARAARCCVPARSTARRRSGASRASTPRPPPFPAGSHIRQVRPTSFVGRTSTFRDPAGKVR